MSNRPVMAYGLQVKDVYDFAYDIAQEFDKIVNFVDIETATPLISKVINVLEMLEAIVKKQEQIETENSELRSKCIQWTCEKAANDEEKFNLKQAFEELEDSWSQESVSLKSFIDKLKKENQLLKHNLAAEKEIPLDTGNSFESVIDDQEKFITKLKSQLKKKDSQLEKNHMTIELLNSKVEDLLKLNKSLHLRYQEVKDLLSTSFSEKCEHKFKQDLQEQKIHDLESRYEALKKSFIEKNECDSKVDIQSHEEKSDLDEDSIKCFLEEQQELKQTVSKLQKELVLIKYQSDEYKRKLIKMTEVQNQNSSLGSGRIQQIFRLFLGVVHINI